MKATIKYTFTRNGQELKVGEPIKYNPNDDNDHRMMKIAIYAGSPGMYMYINKHGNPCGSFYDIVNHGDMFSYYGISIDIDPLWIGNET